MLGPSATLTMIRTIKRIAMVVCLILGLYVGTRVLMGTWGVYRAARQADARSNTVEFGGRGTGRFLMMIPLASIGAGGFVGLASYGLVVVCLKPLDRKMLWSVYRSDGESIRRVASNLPYDEAHLRVSQLGNRELGATFYTRPE